MDSWPTGHRKEVEKPKTRKAKRLERARFALGVALNLREQAEHISAISFPHQGTALERALVKGADMLEELARDY